MIRPPIGQEFSSFPQVAVIPLCHMDIHSGADGGSTATGVGPCGSEG